MLDSYQGNRTQLTRITKLDTELNGIVFGSDFGVPLGNLLYLIYVNDLPKAVQKYIYLLNSVYIRFMKWIKNYSNLQLYF